SPAFGWPFFLRRDKSSLPIASVYGHSESPATGEPIKPLGCPSGLRRAIKRYAFCSSVNWRTRRAFSKQTTLGERNHRYPPSHLADVYFLRSSSGSVIERAKECSSSYRVIASLIVLILLPLILPLPP